MTSRYYIAGPSPQANHWRGKGICEVFEDGTKYVYHSIWPTKYRTDPEGRSSFSSNVSLGQLVADGEWKPYEPLLDLPKGA